MKHSTDFLSAEQFSVGELRQALFGRNPKISPVLAVNLLSRKSYPEKTSDLAQVVGDPSQPAQVRQNAALELSRMQGAKAQAQNEALSPLLSSEEYPFPEKTRLARPDPKRAEKIEIEAAPKISIGAIARQVSSALPGIDFQPVLEQGLTCKQRETALALNGAASLEAMRSNASSIIGVVMERFQSEIDHWELRYVVGVRRTRTRGEFDVFVASRTGQMIASGAAQLKGDEAAFEIATLDIPGIVPFAIAGRYRHGRVTIDEATSDTQARPRIELRPRSPRGGQSAE